MPESSHKIYADAVAAHKKGDLVAAEQGYRALISTNLSEPEPQYLLGAVLAQRGCPADALAPLRTCLNHQPNHAPALNILGSVLSGLGQDDDAIDALNKAATLEPKNAKIRFNLAKACISGKQFELGSEALAALIEIAPDHLEARTAFAACLIELGRPEESIKALTQSISDGHKDARIFEVLIQSLLDTQQYEVALTHAEAARGLWPNSNVLLLAYATTLRLLSRNDEALKAFEALVAAEPNNDYFFNKFSEFLYDTGQWKEAESYGNRALTLAPESAKALTNMGRIYLQRGNFKGAQELYEKAIRIEPDYADVRNNYGNLLLYMDQTGTALEHFDLAIELKPHHQGFRFNRSVTKFTNGDIKGAWREHRTRLNKDGSPVSREWGLPEWDGETLSGKSIVLWGDQGLGDQVIHARCAPAVAAVSNACGLECSNRLTKLFERSFPGVEIFSSKEPLEHILTRGPFDFHCASLDMNCSQYTTPADIRAQPYLKADPELTASLRKKYRAAMGERPLIGISWWSGYSTQAHFKSIPLLQWREIVSVPDATFVSLQYGDGCDELAPMVAETGLTILHDPDVDPAGDMDVFAAQVAAMDLVITISNTTAHFAGALGVPVWNMTPTGPGRLWYWFLEGENSPWYESMRLFRHKYDEGWESVLSSVSDLLTKTAPDLLSVAD